MIAMRGGSQGGSIFRSQGDGSSCSSRASLAPPGRARIAIRITTGVGDVAMQDGELVGELLPQITRIEAITPADEIYPTVSARLGSNAADVQTELMFSRARPGLSRAEAVPRAGHCGCIHPDLRPARVHRRGPSAEADVSSVCWRPLKRV